MKFISKNYFLFQVCICLCPELQVKFMLYNSFHPRDVELIAYG